MSFIFREFFTEPLRRLDNDDWRKFTQQSSAVNEDELIFKAVLKPLINLESRLIELNRKFINLVFILAIRRYQYFIFFLSIEMIYRVL